MKVLLKLILLILLVNIPLSAQFNNRLKNNAGQIAGGFGMTWIDDEPYYLFRFMPEFSFSNFGVGLDLRLEFDKNGKLRSENFNETSDYLSLIRYFRYGLKGDPVYFRIGALDYYTLGHGSIMYQYNNSPFFDSRRTGLSLDIDFNYFGLESIYSDFANTGIIGARAYVRPLQFTNAADIPVIGDVELAVSVASDMNEKAGVISGYYDNNLKKTTILEDIGPMTILGFDLGIPFVKSGLFNLTGYIDYSKIVDFGSGVALGSLFNFNFANNLFIDLKFERRFNGEQYIPSYFNSLYELERFRMDNFNIAKTKANLLKNTPKVNGWYGELLIDVMKAVQVLGSYQRDDDNILGGTLHIYSQIEPDAPFVARAGYDKVNIFKESELFTLNENSYMFAELGYKPYPFLIISTYYSWTFTPIRDGEDAIIDYEIQKRIEPRISFVVPL